MSFDYTGIIVAIIAAVPGVLALLRGWRTQNRKDEASVADIITQASQRALEVMREQFDETCEQLGRTSEHLDDAIRKVEMTQQELDRLGKMYYGLRKDHEDLKIKHQSLKVQHDDLRAAHKKLEEEFDGVFSGAHQLHAQVVELNGQPRYIPPDRRRSR